LYSSQRPKATRTTRSTYISLALGISSGGNNEIDGNNDDNFSQSDDVTSLSSSTTITDDDNNSNNINNVMKGRTILCFVALLYGTLNVSLRLIYQLPPVQYDDGIRQLTSLPPTASTVSAARGLLACLGFVPLLFINKSKNNGGVDNSKDSTTTTNTTTTTEESSSTSTSSSSSSFFTAALEIAFWNFLAQGLLNIGLLSTSSARASFLTQTSVVFTPVISRIFGQTVPSNVWIACGVALIGLTVLSSVGAGGIAAAAATTTTGGFLSSVVQFAAGDWLVLGGAFSWSLYLFRLSKIAPLYNEVNLQFAKTGLLAVLYIIWWIVATVFVDQSGAVVAASTNGSVSGSLIPFLKNSFGWLLSGFAFLTLLYSALGPGTAADVLQQQGQKEVSASEANVILSLEPVFTALCAWIVLGELASTQETIGGAMILGAALLATR
jgi:drug/metabolite transporter (DMT)-like permease